MKRDCPAPLWSRDAKLYCSGNPPFMTDWLGEVSHLA